MSGKCKCKQPLLGYKPGVGPRCRLCNKPVDTIRGTTRNDFDPKLVLDRLGDEVIEAGTALSILEEACHRILRLEHQLMQVTVNLAAVANDLKVFSWPGHKR